MNYSPSGHWYLHIFLHPPWGGSKPRNEASGRGCLPLVVDPNCQWSPPRKLAGSFPTLPKEGEMCCR